MVESANPGKSKEAAKQRKHHNQPGRRWSLLASRFAAVCSRTDHLRKFNVQPT
jgi:hypothetical protein